MVSTLHGLLLNGSHSSCGTAGQNLKSHKLEASMHIFQKLAKTTMNGIVAKHDQTMHWRNCKRAAWVLLLLHSLMCF